MSSLLLFLMFSNTVNVAFAQSTQYSYDSLNRLTEVRYPDKVIRYAYDAAGNRSDTTVENLTAAPSITNISPNAAIVGGNGFTLTVNGSNFTNNSIVQWNGVTRPTTFVSANQLTAAVSSSDIGKIGTAAVTVLNQTTGGVSNAQTFTVQSGAIGCLPVSIPNTTGQTNTTVIVPVMVGDLTNAGVEAYDFTILFDPSVVVPAAVTVDKIGTLSSSMNIVSNSPSPGKLIVSAAGTNYLSGQGTLIKLRFDVLGAPQSTSALSWQQFQFGEGMPCTTVASGQITVGNAVRSISGRVTYANTPMNQTARFIRNVSLTAAGSPQVTASTDLNGSYSLNNLGTSGYTVTPSKAGDVNGISSLDASRIQQYLVGLIALSPNQLIAADVNNSGTVTSLDASRLQQYLVGLPSTNSIGQWRFIPSNRQYNSVTSDITGEDYQAVLIGEVSGNWTAPANIADTSENSNDSFRLSKEFFGNENSATVAGIAVSLPANAAAANGAVITIPITVGDISGSVIESFDFSVFYNSAVLQPASPVGSNTGTLSANCSVLANSPIAGRVTVSGACGNPPLTSGQGVLYNLRFTVIGTAGQQTALSFTNPQTNQNTFLFNDGDPQAKTSAGNFSVIPSTAANVSVGGRVLTESGRGIGNVRVTLTDTNGNSRTISSTTFGYYRFIDVPAGGTYIISVSAKKYNTNSDLSVRI